MTVEVRKAVALAGLLGVWLALAGAAPVDEDIPAATVRLRVEQDWLRQGEAWAEAEWSGRRVPVSTAADAAGAVDGVKNGKYAFHTAHEPNPWWQVDLGRATPIARIVVFNRLDYAPGLHNADNLIVLTSDDGRAWTQRHANKGQHFGGVSGAKPLEVACPPGKLAARFIRLQIPSDRPIYFHLDEVEVYGPDDPQKNIALGRPADQSSLSRWSTVKPRPRPDGPLPPMLVYPTAEVIKRGRRLAVELRAAGVDAGPSEREMADVTVRLERLPANAGPDEHRALYLTARWAVRRLAFANPLLRMNALLFVTRFTQQTYPDICLNHMPWVSRPGGDLCILVNPFAADGNGQRVRSLLNGALGPGHVHGMDLWWDADRIVFGYAKSKTGQPPFPWPPPHCAERFLAHDLRKTEEPTHLFEVRVDGKGLRQLSRHEYWSDLDPTYLPNGDIAFASERCGYSLQCNHDPRLDETSCNLYVMRPDGASIRRLSVNKDGDYLPH
ncbi:MAG: hypothetical protein FJ279_18650, partial [Planctomycetes bacterium]|nr:hypothetical protein [Planctomycetota bacterium]